MSKFIHFKAAIRQQMATMSESDLFRVDVDKDALWQTYLSSFPEGTNPLFKERTEHDCQCCKQFIRSAGGIVSVVDNQLVSIWDIDIGGHFQVVADAMAGLVKAQRIEGTLLHPEKHLGTDHNHQLLESGTTVTWEHFHFELRDNFVMTATAIGPALSNLRTGKDVFERGLKEILITATETVMELIDQNSIYRGEENAAVLELFLKHQVEYAQIPDDQHHNYYWSKSVAIGGAARIRNTAIGTLLVDISNGMDLDAAVRSFETKVAPQNYKRPSAVISKSMIANAQEKVEELGITESLQRRFAVPEDVTINNVLFADRSAKKAMNVFDKMAEQVPENIKSLEKVDEVDINTFIESILPKADNIELMLENQHTSNLMSLIAPIDAGAKQIFKWDNNFSWAYNGEVADSMKERVKSAGGNVEGVLRFSIQWNDGDNNQNDFDAHCVEPDGNLIYYQNAQHVHRSTGVLDVDIQNPGSKIAVENITWSDKSKMQEGIYHLVVHNYSHNGGKTGFAAEIEYGGKIYSYQYKKELRLNEKVVVAVIKFSQENGIEFIESLPSTQASKEVWGVATQQFRRVSMVMNSPNHWDGRTTGNKHLFFILDGCKNDKKARGFFNEFLKEDLSEHRKVFEVLGSKTKAEVAENQLSGLGFSSTQRNHIFCRVTGAFARVIKINF